MAKTKLPTDKFNTGVHLLREMFDNFSANDEVSKRKFEAALQQYKELKIEETYFKPVYNAMGANSRYETIKEDIRNALYHPEKIIDKGDKTMADTFELTDENKTFLDTHGIKPEEVKSKDAYDALVTQFSDMESFNLEETTKAILLARGVKEENISAISSIEELDAVLKPKEEGKDDKGKETEGTEEFVLSDEDKTFLAKYGINEKAVTSKEILATLKEQFKGELKPEDEISLTDDMKKWLQEKEFEADKVKTVKDLTDSINKTVPLDVEGKEKEQGGEERTEDSDWVKRKAAYYKELAEKNAILGYEELRADSIFSAKFNDATVTYSSPTSVSVSPEAKISVFETIVTDPDNKHRPINFSDTMSKEMQARLYAACLLNGATLGKNAPAELSEEQMKLIKAELGDRYAEFEKKYDELHKPAEPEKDDKDKDKEPKPFDDKVKEDIKKGLTDQYELAAMTADGRITFEKHMEDRGDKGVVEVSTPKGNDEDVAKYKELLAKSAEQTEFLKDKFQENPAAFRDIIAQVLPELKEKAKSDELSTKLDKIKAKVDADKKREENREDWQKDRADKLQQQKNVMGAKLGIPGYKAEGVTALAGDELDKYITDNKISAYTYGLLGGKDDSMVNKFVIVGKEDSKLPGEQKKADFEKGKMTRETLLNGGKERS